MCYFTKVNLPSSKVMNVALIRRLVILVILAAAFCAVALAVGDRLITCAYYRTGPEWLNRLIQNTDNGPLDYYFRAERVSLCKLL